MKNLVSKLLFISIAILPGCFGPSDFDECILKNMKGVNNGSVADAIYESCENKFPKKEENKRVDIPPNVLADLEGKFEFLYPTLKTLLKGTIYNPNLEWTITRITFEIGPIPNRFEPKKESDPLKIKKYQKGISLKPQSVDSFSIDILEPPTKFNVNIISAKGYK